MRANLSALCCHLFTQHTYLWEDLIHSIREGSPGTRNNTTQDTSTNSNLQIISYTATDLLCKKKVCTHTLTVANERACLCLSVGKSWRGSVLFYCVTSSSHKVWRLRSWKTLPPSHICTSKATKLSSGCSNYRLSNDLLHILKKSNPIFDTLCGYCYSYCKLPSPSSHTGLKLPSHTQGIYRNWWKYVIFIKSPVTQR